MAAKDKVRDERLAAALRDNLKRRKAQAREAQAREAQAREAQGTSQSEISPDQPSDPTDA